VLPIGRRVRADAIGPRPPPREGCRDNALGLAEAARRFGPPVVPATGRDRGPGGPVPLELRQTFPDVPVARRTGATDARRWPAFRGAVAATGRGLGASGPVPVTRRGGARHHVVARHRVVGRGEQGLDPPVGGPGAVGREVAPAAVQAPGGPGPAGGL
jgi:hypothetical protein